MIRRVFLIGAPLDDKSGVFYRGVLADANNFNRYFQSAVGGAFMQSEITYLENPRWAILQRVIQQRADYSILVFTGHGYYSTNQNLPVVNLNSKERIPVSEIRKNIFANKKLIIVDSCQAFQEDYESFEGIGDPGYMNFTSTLPLNQARMIFNRELSSTPDGHQTLYSCSPGETSVLTSTGSVFTNSLLTNIQDWSARRTDSTLMKAAQAFKISERHLQVRRLNQTPVLKVSLTRPNFPLAAKRPIPLWA